MLTVTAALCFSAQLGWDAQNVAPSSALAFTTAQVPANSYIGISHIGYGSEPPVAQRYQLARAAGASWDRWALYWTDVEKTKGQLAYSAIDATVAADQAHGLKTLAVLMSTPDWASTAPVPKTMAANVGPRLGQKGPETAGEWSVMASAPSTATFAPKNLYTPIFTDGTDTPGAGKTINQDNYWAMFVFQTAARYKGKIDSFEIWNEPDYKPAEPTGWFGFWSGSLDEYRRLLKVGYIAVKSANPGATVLMGGMAYWSNQTFFPQLLDIILKDGDSSRNSYYFDATSWHWYGRSRLLMDQTDWAKNELLKRKLQNKGVWITEAGMPVCNDAVVGGQPYCSAGSHRGTSENQASFIIQAAAYALTAGVDKLFFFQLYDDAVGPFEYYGLIRNDGSIRPAYYAVQLAANYFRDPTWVYRTPSRGGKLELITMYLADGRRIRAVWDYSGDAAVLRSQIGIPADSATAALVQYDTTTTSINGGNYYYYLRLSPANLDDDSSGGVDYIVGGSPQLLVESGTSNQPGSVGGTIRSQYSQPVKGALLTTSSGNKVATDGVGSFSFSLPPGLYDLDASAKGYRSPGPIMSVPVWSARGTEATMLLQFLHNTYLPLLFKRFTKR
ncbi:MAG: hypothetical protein EXR50_01330 [Dehalococcoidia bacterium]|nr:hypothetical protein [Dehalococcoidia bacterium]